MRVIIAACALGVLLGACSTTNIGDQGPMSYRQEFAQLQSTCEARGGILTPLGQQTGPRPANDYACEIRGGASGRLN